MRHRAAVAKQGELQRMATFGTADGTFTKPGDNRAVANALNTAMKGDPTAGALLTASLHMGRGQLNTPRIAGLIESILESRTDFGTFDLRVGDHRHRLAGVLTQEDLLNQARPVPKQAETEEELPSTVAVKLPEPLNQQRNMFKVVRPKKAELLETLARWNAYYQYKMAQFHQIERVDSDYYDTLSGTDRFKNFENLGTMIPMVTSAILKKTAEELLDEVRVAVNPSDADRIAAVLIYNWKPKGDDADPSYISDVLADPKSIRPDRREGEAYKQRKSQITDPTAKGRGRIAIGEASAQRGGAPSLLQHAVIESGPAGIELWPLDPVTRKIYLAMRFGDAHFVETSEKNLLLAAGDMEAFAQHAVGSLAQSIKDWKQAYFG